jgi:hypothetical protein
VAKPKKKRQIGNVKNTRPPAAARTAPPRAATLPASNGAEEKAPPTMTAAERGRARREALRTRRQQQSRSRRFVTVGLVVVLVAVLGGILWYQNYQDSLKPGERFADLGNRHLNQGETYTEYNSNPPTSGPHYPNIAPWGIHDQPIANELQVHNLEDGGVVIQYKDIPTDVLDQLRGIVGRYTDKVVLAPNDTLSNAIVLTAWTRMVRLGAFDEQKIVEFIEAYRGIDHHKAGTG